MIIGRNNEISSKRIKSDMIETEEGKRSKDKEIGGSDVCSVGVCLMLKNLNRTTYGNNTAKDTCWAVGSTWSRLLNVATVSSILM